VQMLKAGSKRRLSKAEYAEKKRVNADKDAALAEKLAHIKHLESELIKANQWAGDV
jgi:hypothetical protein